MSLPLHPLPLFPDRMTYARAHFEEVERHLHDARLLHKANRSAASIASSMKAVELGIKSVLILDGIQGWFDINQHEILTKAEGNKLLGRHIDALTGFRASLPLDIKELETLVPARQDKQGNLELTKAMNPEYPFFAFTITSGGPTPPQLYTPGAYFTSTDSEKHYRTAHDLLSALQGIYSDIAAWRIRLSRPL